MKSTISFQNKSILKNKTKPKNQQRQQTHTTSNLKFLIGGGGGLVGLNIAVKK